MKKLFFFVALILVSGCARQPALTVGEVSTRPSPKERAMDVVEKKESIVHLPIENYLATYKRFGEYFEDRFRGYHVGDDIEVVDVPQEVPVYAIAKGVVKKVDWATGYGGVVVVEYTVGNETTTAIYGHLDIDSSTVVVGDEVESGQFIANLGDDKSRETDGERQHLHFALYPGKEDGRLQGYEQNATDLANWINPYDFFIQHGIVFDTFPRTYSALINPQGKKIFNIDFDLPRNLDVEYIPSLRALNLYTLEGAGTALDRSQILIRYFDANEFLTLSTVTIHETTNLTVGKEDYVARRYDIEKKPGAPDFPDQPSWRNERHIVTDFRKATGRTRYYVVAADPDLKGGLYAYFLDSMLIY